MCFRVATHGICMASNRSGLKAPPCCKKDLPLETRCPLSILLGLRRQLINWGFSRRAIRVSDDNLTMTIDRKPILTATTCSDQVRLEWLDQTWKEWKELQDSSELKQLIDRANEALKNAAFKRTKGEGKGKPTATVRNTMFHLLRFCKTIDLLWTPFLLMRIVL